MDNKLAREFHTGSLIRFALPNIVMMVFMSLYTIVDGMFVSRCICAGGKFLSGSYSRVAGDQ